MKFTVIIAVITVLCALIIPARAAAEETDNVREELENDINESLGKLDLGDLDAFIQSLGGDYSDYFGEIEQFLSDVIKGEKSLSFSDTISGLLKITGRQLMVNMPIFLMIICVAILFSIMSSLSAGFINHSTNELIYFVCYAAIIVLVVSRIAVLAASAAKTINMLSGLMQAVFPILLTLMTALGGLVSVSVYRPVMALISTSVVGLVTKFILPCFIITIILSVAGSINKDIKLDKLSKFFKSTAEYVVGIVFGLFMSFIAVQGIAGSISDSISIKSAKFAMSSYVPILGGYLSEGFDLILASCVLIKNAVGITGVILLVGIILAPICNIAVFILGLRLVAGIIEPLCDKRIAGLLYKVSKSLTLLIVAILAVAFMFFIMIMLVIYTCNMGVV